MTYKEEVWAKRAQRVGNLFLMQCTAKGERGPLLLGRVRDLIEFAYKQGVIDALKVAREIDGTD